MTIQLADSWQAWKGAPKAEQLKARATRIGEGHHDGYDVEVYRARAGRITIRCYYWHSEQDISREGYILDHFVSGVDLATAETRARECGYPVPALLAAISEAEEVD